MAVKGPIEFVHYWIGLSTDTKPTLEMGASPGDEFFEADTGLWYILGSSGAWVEAGAGGTSSPGTSSLMFRGEWALVAGCEHV